jgi:enediyne biosynthesis protein E4
MVKRFNYSTSCIAINKGNGQFTIQKFPAMVQMSSVNAIHCLDINNDGHTDVVLGGNQFDFQPQLGRLDASQGDILINDGKGNLQWTEAARTGLQLRGQLRDIAEIHERNKKYLLFLQNNEYPVLYRLNDHPKTNKKN